MNCRSWVGGKRERAVRYLAVGFWNSFERESMAARKLVVRVADTGGMWSRCVDHNTAASVNKVNVTICTVLWPNQNKSTADTSVYSGRSTKSSHVYLSGLDPNCLSTSAYCLVVNGCLVWVQKMTIVKTGHPRRGIGNFWILRGLCFEAYVIEGLAPLEFDPWRRDDHAVAKRRAPATRWHDVIFHNCTSAKAYQLV